MPDRPVGALILAAGEGKKMKPTYPKVLAQVLFRPMIGWVQDWCQKAGIRDVGVVVPPESDAIRALFPAETAFFVQQQPLGTGHGVQLALEFLKAHKGGDILVLNGDAPFVDDTAITGALAAHRAEAAAITVVTAEVSDPTGFWRIVRAGADVCAIVAHADADEITEKISEVHSGAFWFSADFLLRALDTLLGERPGAAHSLTDTVQLAVQENSRVLGWRCENSDIVRNANDCKGLLALQNIAKDRVFARLLEEGVNLLSTDGVLISPEVQIGPDTDIYPGVIIRGKTVIGSGCTITSGSQIVDCVIGADTTITASHMTKSQVGSHCKIGPFSQLRPDSVVGEHVKIGDFVEVKNSTVGNNTSISHLTYVGDSDVGARVNFGCGVVTVNYSGKSKARTTIGDDAFIGCNTNLVAPVTVGVGAYTAAGSTITEDVPRGALAIARSRQSIKPGWANDYLGDKRKK